MKRPGQRAFAIGLTVMISCGSWKVPAASGYAFNEIVPDVRQPVNISGGSACPVRSHVRHTAAARTMRWSTMLNTNPVTIITQDQTASGRLTEIEQVITQSMGAWSGVSGTTLQAVPATVVRTGVQNACGTDGVNSICFDQADLAFTPGVLAFTRAITADRIGVQAGGGTPATEVGEILDADIYFNPSDSHVAYATPSALSERRIRLRSGVTARRMSWGTRWGSAIPRCGVPSCFRMRPRRGLSAECAPRRNSRTLHWDRMTVPGCGFCIPTRRIFCTRDLFAAALCRQIRYRCPHSLQVLLEYLGLTWWQSMRKAAQ